MHPSDIDFLRHILWEINFCLSELHSMNRDDLFINERLSRALVRKQSSSDKPACSTIDRRFRIVTTFSSSPRVLRYELQTLAIPFFTKSPVKIVFWTCSGNGLTDAKCRTMIVTHWDDWFHILNIGWIWAGIMPKLVASPVCWSVAASKSYSSRIPTSQRGLPWQFGHVAAGSL